MIVGDESKSSDDFDVGNDSSNSKIKLIPRITISENTGEVFSCKFSDDGQFLAAGCGDGAIRVFNSQTGVMSFNLQGGSNVSLPTTAMSFRPNNQTGAFFTNWGIDMITRDESTQIVIWETSYQRDQFFSVLLTAYRPENKSYLKNSFFDYTSCGKNKEHSTRCKRCWCRAALAYEQREMPSFLWRWGQSSLCVRLFCWRISFLYGRSRLCCSYLRWSHQSWNQLHERYDKSSLECSVCYRFCWNNTYVPQLGSRG